MVLLNSGTAVKSRLFPSSRRQDDCSFASIMLLSTRKQIRLFRNVSCRVCSAMGIKNNDDQIVIRNSQRKYAIDIDLTRRHISKILEVLNIPNFSVFLLICSDAKMREISKNLRQKSKSTDILSYSLPAGANDPVSGVKEGPSYLGTMIICPSFVERQMLADKEAYEVML